MMTLIQRHLLACLLLATLAGNGCSPHKIQDLTEPAVNMPESLGTAPLMVEMPEHWWTAFEEPDLDRLVFRAFDSNLNLAQAWARLDQARAQAAIQGAYRFPEVNLDAAASRSKQVPLDDRSVYGNRFALGLGLTWELDLWQKIANRAEAAQLLAEATRDDAEQTALLLSETVVELWFTIQEQEQLLAVLNEQINSSRQQVDLIELRYGQGVGDALQVLQQRLQLAQVQAEVPTVKSILETTRNQLAIVLGHAPQFALDTTPAPVLPELPAFPQLPSPRDLLEQRPDLRAAHARLAAADHEVAASVADML
ncbi:MAG: TolC family protein, partial [Phycisphaerales bacterium]|nr:TolC family protein [Phycisphaerales bacterium]